MSCIALVEALIDDALARQKAGRVTREDCVERMIDAALDCSKGDREAMSAALDAAIASGYIIINRP